MFESLILNKHLKNEGSFGSDCNRERICELLGNNAMRSSTPVKAGFYFSPVLSIQNLEKWGGGSVRERKLQPLFRSPSLNSLFATQSIYTITRAVIHIVACMKWLCLVDSSFAIVPRKYRE